MDGCGQQAPALAHTHVEPINKAAFLLKGACGRDLHSQVQARSDQQTTTSCSCCLPSMLSFDSCSEYLVIFVAPWLVHL